MIETLLAHDHEELDGTLAELKSALSAGDAVRSLERLDRFWARLAMHIRAENHELFPVLKRAAAEAPDAEKILSILAGLRHDHDFSWSS
jgi:iron-sulfur cluster repair protein YtfE (RIC family)